MPSLDIETRRKTNREYYSRNKERIKQTQLARSKKYYEENKNYKLEAASKYRKENQERCMWHRTKQRAKRQKIIFDIEISDIQIPTHCPILGIQLEFAGENWDNSPSIDKIIPELGYVKGNIHVISMRANRIKSDATLKELQMLTTYMENINDEIKKYLSN